MAIIGGAGNPVGGSFTGPAEALEIVGDHAYGYSGLIAANTTETTAFSFTTGNYYTVGYLQLNGPVDDDSPGDVVLAACKVSFNGTGVFILATGDEVHRAPRSVRQKIIIPSYTEVTVTIDAESIAADQYGSVVITGRIYRTRD